MPTPVISGYDPLDLSSTIEYANADAMRTFFVQHNIRHQLYASKIVSATVAVPLFDVSDQGALDDWIDLMSDVMDKQEATQSDRTNNWLNMHLALHNGEMAALGLGDPVDVATVDLKKPEQFYDWLLIHQQMHDAEDAALGI